MVIAEFISVVLTTSTIVLVGMFFSFGHLIKLRKYTLPIRKRDKELDLKYKNREKHAKEFSETSFITFIIVIAESITAIFFNETFNPIAQWIIFYSFIIGIICLLLFIIFINHLRSIVK